MIPLYNAIVSFGHHRPVMKNKTGAMNAASFDNFNNAGEYIGPPITDLLKFLEFLNRDKPAWKFFNIFSHADGRYLKSFQCAVKPFRDKSGNDWVAGPPDASLVEDCGRGIWFDSFAKTYGPNNKFWLKKQQLSGCLAQNAVTKEISTPAPLNSQQRKTKATKFVQPVFVDNDGDPFPEFLQEIYREEQS